MSHEIKYITVNAEIPKGVAFGDLSRRYPEVSFSITNGHWVSKDERILYVTCRRWKEEYSNFLKGHSAVRSIVQIGNIAKIHIKSGFLRKFEQKDMTIIYPTVLRDGSHRIEFLIDKDQLQSLKEGITNIRILKITDSYRADTKITKRQEEILWKAYSFGYFRYPRGITLTNLAKLLKVSKATLSQTLRIVEDKAIKLLLER